MAKRYQLWDGQSTIITPANEVLTPAEWQIKYAWFVDSETTPMVIAAGFFNGGFCMPLMGMAQVLAGSGATFESGLSAQELLNAIEAWENEQAAQATSAISPEERMAAALEYQNLLTM